MGMEFETTGSIQFEPGAYEGHLLKIQKRFKVFTTKDESGQEVREDRSFYLWYFAVDEEGFEDVTLTAISFTSWGPKSKARSWANAILRRKLADGEKFTEDDLKNKPVLLHIDNEETDRGTFARIVNLTQVRAKAASRKKEEEPKERDLSEKDLKEMHDALDDNDDAA
jgi:hypothetical protein